MSNEKATPTIGSTVVQDVAGGIIGGIEENAAAAAANANPQPAKPSQPNQSTGSPAWKKEPIRNFELDAAGNVKLKDNGQPQRRPGNPAKPRRGDTLADGSIFQPEGKAAGSHKPPKDNPSTVHDPFAQPAGDDPAVDVDGIALSEVAIEGLDNTAAAVAGDKARMSDPEKQAATKYAGKSLGDTEIDATTALLLILGGWALRVWLTMRGGKPSQGKQPNNADDPTRVHSGAVGNRQDASEPIDRHNGIKDWERHYRT